MVVGRALQHEATGEAIRLDAVSKAFGSGPGAVMAVDRASFAINQNEFFTLLGPSGCGKTTLLRMIAGFEHATSGRILLDGADVSGLPPYRRPVNTVFQNYALFPHMSVAENIGFGLRMLERPEAEVTRRVAEMLALVRMEDLADRRTSQISGGQQQRVALARALAPSPKVLLLDEPLSALDLKLRKAMQIELKRLQQETGITFVFVTHDQEEALTMSDRIAVMSKGRVLQIGSPREIYDNPAERFVADFIGDTNFLPATITDVAGDAGTVTFASGARASAHVPDGAPVSGRVTVAVRPEHASLTRDAEGVLLGGVITNAVFFGTDTHFHVALDGGEHFVVREQNETVGPAAFAVGERVGIRVNPGCLQVLKD